MESFRGFIAVEIPFANPIQALEQEISELDAKIKSVEPENIHITLKFLGETPANYIEKIETMMKQAVTGIRQHSICLIGTGVFPNERYIKVIWIGIQQGEKLINIASKLDDQLRTLGFKKENRPFSPHLTIGRVKNIKGKDQVLSLIKKHENTIFTEVNVTEIKLKKSTLTPNGPIYETLSTVLLEE
jgi:2'-5' RNA ligase